MPKLLYDSWDSWGPCCSDCEWRNQATKPCDVCSYYRRGEKPPEKYIAKEVNYEKR